jgi:hypothetical protein
MSESAATLILTLVAAYLGVGLVFGLGFASRWSGRLDPVAAEGTTGFRLLIFPGSTLLWPYLVVRLLRTRQRRP